MERSVCSCASFFLTSSVPEVVGFWENARYDTRASPIDPGAFPARHVCARSARRPRRWALSATSASPRSRYTARWMPMDSTTALLPSFRASRDFFLVSPPTESASKSAVLLLVT